MRRAALVLVLVTGACAATPTPAREQLAEALGERGPARSTDITHIACEPLDAASAEVACRWRQRHHRRWQDWQSQLARTGEEWQLIDTPERRP